MGKVNYSTTTVNKDGTLIEGDVTYNVSATIVNNELQRLACSIMKQVAEGEFPIHIGSISSEYSRQIIDIPQGENLIPHLTVFQEILNEEQGNTQID